MKSLMKPFFESGSLPKATTMRSMSLSPALLAFRAPVIPRTQRGVALFFALVLLLIMTLLGLAVVQVTTLQERMAGSYRQQNKAFQNAEAVLADKEAKIADAINSGKTFIADIENCVTPADKETQTWAGAITPAEAAATTTNVVTQRLDRCAFMPGFAGKKMGGKLNEASNTVYQITAAGTDDPDHPDDAVAVSVFDTVYMP